MDELTLAAKWVFGISNYVRASLGQYRRAHVAVMLGVAVATAVLTGALLVGDSVRGSLRDLTLQRLGRIDQALVTGQPFRDDLAAELSADKQVQQAFDSVHAALQLRGSLSSTVATQRHAGGVAIIGVSDDFAELGDAKWARDLNPGEIAITTAVADDLRVVEGAEILLRLPTATALPADSPLGEKSETTTTRRLTVARILPPHGLARFSLQPSQAPPRNAFVRLATLQSIADLPDKINTLLVASGGETEVSSEDEEQLLQESLRPALADYGLQVFGLASDAKQIESDQLVLPPAVVDAAQHAFGEAIQPVSTYLANTIQANGKSVSYSTVAGVDSTREMGPLLDQSGDPIVLADDEIALNDWAARRLGAEVDDTVALTYYQPESTHGELVEAPPAKFTLRAIVPLEDATGQPTAAADPHLTPTLEGVTDAESMEAWELPFDLTEPIIDDDEEYWDEHRTTPKAFITHVVAERLWRTRWGATSLVRVPSKTVGVAETLRDAIDPTDLGFVFQPVKRQGLAAAAGTTPFDGLFLGFSMFLIAAAIALVVLLFGLGVEQRAAEVGLLSAVGFGAPRLRSLLTREGMLVAAAGVALGVPLGIAYAWLMIAGLTTLWVAAIAAPFLELHVTLRSLLIGATLGLAAAWLAIRFALRRIVRLPARQLLAGETRDAGGISAASGRGFLLAAVLAVGAVALGVYGARLDGEAQAGAFFGSGAALLVGLLLAVRHWLRGRRIDRPAPSRFALRWLALRNVARNPGRTMLTLGLVASASFLILAISAFRLAPTEAGTGGMALVAESSVPIHYDLNTPEGRLELGLSAEDESLLNEFRVYAFRVHDGEDASCLNLYQTQQPRVLGAPDAFIERGGFAFADSIGEDGTTVWGLLRGTAGPSRENAAARKPFPAILDSNTAKYSLKLGGAGSILEIRDGADQPARLIAAAMLKNSMLQGDLIVSEASFLNLYPETSGHRFFLIEPTQNNSDPIQVENLAAMLEDRLSNYGFDAESAEKQLAGFLAVQNTYLSTFQTLGALGLLLGVAGVAVVQLRNINERRGELALLQATGFDRRRLGRLVLLENLLLLLGGLAIGGVAALAALLPQTTTVAARPPWLTTALLLGVIAIVGVAVGAAATRRVLRAPIVPALRGE